VTGPIFLVNSEKNVRDSRYIPALPPLTSRLDQSQVPAKWWFNERMLQDVISYITCATLPAVDCDSFRTAVHCQYVRRLNKVDRLRFEQVNGLGELELIDTSLKTHRDDHPVSWRFQCVRVALSE